VPRRITPRTLLTVHLNVTVRVLEHVVHLAGLFGGHGHLEVDHVLRFAAGEHG